MSSSELTNLCRVCSGLGIYDIHSRIPFFLHSRPIEYNCWPKTIAVLLEEITGNLVTSDDSMPQKICTVCISYLKHAAVFRQQAINNLLSLQTAKGLNNKLIDIVSNNNIPEIVKSNTKSIPDGLNGKNNMETYRELKEELDLFFDDNNIDYSDDDSDVDDDDPESGDDNAIVNRLAARALNKSENIKTAIHNFFNYSEKPFEEDDITSVFDNILIKIPESNRERKCHACSRRFMLNDSYDTHLKECIQIKLINFIKDSQQLLVLKKHKAVSSQEFVRRMIFSLKNIVKALALCYRVLVASPPPPAPPPQQQQQQPSLLSSSSQTSQLINVQSQLPSSSTSTSVKPTIAFRISNTKNILNNNIQSKILEKKILKTTNEYMFQAVNPAGTLKPTKKELSTKLPNFVAKCPTCKQTFDSLQALERHNQELHNRSVSVNSLSNQSDYSDCSESRRTLLELLNSVDYQHEGIVDVMKLRQKSLNIKKNIQNNLQDGQ